MAGVFAAQKPVRVKNVFSTLLAGFPVFYRYMQSGAEKYNCEKGHILRAILWTILTGSDMICSAFILKYMGQWYLNQILGMGGQDVGLESISPQRASDRNPGT